VQAQPENGGKKSKTSTSCITSEVAEGKEDSPSGTARQVGGRD
jgi:hypothetical protein